MFYENRFTTIELVNIIKDSINEFYYTNKFKRYINLNRICNNLINKLSVIFSKYTHIIYESTHFENKDFLFVINFL